MKTTEWKAAFLAKYYLATARSSLAVVLGRVERRYDAPAVHVTLVRRPRVFLVEQRVHRESLLGAKALEAAVNAGAYHRHSVPDQPAKHPTIARLDSLLNLKAIIITWSGCLHC